MRIVAAIGCIAAFAAVSADAQPMLVRTTALSALREAGKSYLHIADLTTGRIHPRHVALPGPAPVGPLFLGDNGSFAVAGSGPSSTGDVLAHDAAGTYMSPIVFSPLEIPALSRIRPRAGWRFAPGGVGRFPESQNPLLLALAMWKENDGRRLGAVEAYELGPAPTFRPGAVHGPWPLPGAPVAAVVLPPGDRAAVLCRQPRGSGAMLRVLDLATGKAILPGRAAFTGPDLRDATEPAALAFDASQGLLYALTSGYAVDKPQGDPVSWLHAYAIADLTPVGPPVEAPGHAMDAQTPLRPAGPYGCWLTTRAPSAAFGYVTRIRFAPEGGVTETALAFRDVWQTPTLDCAPDGRVAAAFESRLEIWPQGAVSGPTHVYEAPIRVAAWADGSLIVGEANRLHRVNPETARPITTVSFQSGAVMDAVLLPEEARFDPSETAPRVPVPRLDLPAEITLHAGAAGRELQALHIASPYGEGYVWRVEYNASAMPWLRVFPTTGLLPASSVAYLGIDPARFGPADQPIEENLLLILDGGPSRPQPENNPFPVTIRVEPPRDIVRRILWIGAGPPSQHEDRDPDSGDAYRRVARFPSLSRLADVLAAPPHSFSHVEATVPFLDPLTPYAVVVIDAQAAVDGAVTRAALFDYVARGGAMLFVGRTVPEEKRAALAGWLDPVGIHILADAPMEGVWRVQPTHPLLSGLETLRIAGGVGFRLEEQPRALVASGSDSAAFAILEYGAGRIAVLAAATPLENAQQAAGSLRENAARLFEWLARNRQPLQDVDADGLPDFIEDKNNNGAVDPGETDRLRSDSDNDGLPDGMEDQNRNGRVDPGETSPINPDSDGDGVFDGADPSPVPPTDAPVIDAVSPVEGPAEGGTRVVLTGRNVPPDATLWFGSNKAASLRVLSDTALIAQTPPCALSQGETVDVRIRGAAPNAATVLPGGFRYTPLSKVTLALEALQAASDEYQKAVAVRLHPETETMAGLVTFRLTALPAHAIAWGAVTPGAAASQSGRAINVRPDPSGGIVIDISPAQHGPYWGELAIVRWISRFEPTTGPMRLSIDRARVLAPNGSALIVRTQDLSITPIHFPGPETAGYTAPQ
ncbi:MAG TPA: IPT/TIG domain-containing protein [Candidatus Hydrogenedentes bacterium]|nr:IPT/TIG domain-containing protein [Candidatus Hydrogenedentota bacterium]